TIDSPTMPCRGWASTEVGHLLVPFVPAFEYVKQCVARMEPLARLRASFDALWRHPGTMVRFSELFPHLAGAQCGLQARVRGDERRLVQWRCKPVRWPNLTPTSLRAKSRSPRARPSASAISTGALAS